MNESNIPYGHTYRFDEISDQNPISHSCRFDEIYDQNSKSCSFVFDKIFEKSPISLVVDLMILLIRPPIYHSCLFDEIFDKNSISHRSKINEIFDLNPKTRYMSVILQDLFPCDSYSDTTYFRLGFSHDAQNLFKIDHVST